MVQNLIDDLLCGQFGLAHTIWYAYSIVGGAREPEMRRRQAGNLRYQILMPHMILRAGLAPAVDTGERRWSLDTHQIIQVSPG
jgi:hypothetical protein